MTEQIAIFSKEIARLNEQVVYLTKKLYGKSSEKSLGSEQGQLSLFEDEDLSEKDDDLHSKRRF